MFLKFKRFLLVLGLAAPVLVLFVKPEIASAAVLSVSPQNGSFVIGSTFNVEIILNTENQTVNTIRASLSYPPDQLQLVSPSAGNSIISLWSAVPFVDNQNGLLVLQGGVPNGIKTDSGIITTLQFRVKSIGHGIIKFTDDSRVLLNDGRGTDVLDKLSGASYVLVLPPPAGPIVSSPTHPDQSVWYNLNSAVINWSSSDVVDLYSFMLDDQPITIPDDIPDGKQESVQYRGVPDGIHYFHIKALHNGLWGGTTHFVVKVDTAPPAVFPVSVLPAKRTSQSRPVIQFSTTDALSGLAYYEVQTISLSVPGGGTTGAKPLFVETTSPYIPQALPLGSYDVTIRAYDQAGNFREITTRLSIVEPLFSQFGPDGIVSNNQIIITWPALFTSLAFLAAVLTFILWLIRRKHRQLDLRSNVPLPSEVKSQLDELHKYRKKYGLLIVLFVFGSLFLSRLDGVRAADRPPATPPIVSSFSGTITNNEIFYVGGQTLDPGSKVIIYLQNLESGEVVSTNVVSDEKGAWFYRHTGFLTSGDYRVWFQEKNGEALSAPSPQKTLSVRTDAVQFGVSRISIEALYLIITVVALLVILVLVVYVVFHGYSARQKHRALQREIREAEESIKRGFAVLRRDIEQELTFVRSLKLSKGLSSEEHAREAVLAADLSRVESIIGKEVWRIQKIEERN